MIVSNKVDIENLIEAGKRLRDVLEKVLAEIKDGTDPVLLDKMAYDLIKEKGDEPSFLNYKPFGSSRSFPATLCVSVNEEMVHGIPGEGVETLKEGDIVTLDCGLIHKGFYVDAAKTIPVGKIDDKAKALINATGRALEVGIIAARAGATIGDVGAAIEEVAKDKGFTIPPELGGHGVGASVHEDPFIPNIGNEGEGEKFVEGQVVAIEPIFTEGSSAFIEMTENDFTYRATDKARSAHFEHTLLITKETPIIVTGGRMWDYKQN